MRPFPHPSISSLALAVSFAFAACGDSDPGDTGAAGGAAASSTQGTGTSTGSTAASGTGSTSVASTTSGTGGGGGGGEPTASLRLVDLGLPIDLTPDGHTALIQDLASPVGDIYLLDTAGGDPMLLTSVGDPTRDLATGISASGAVSALHADPVEAGVFAAGAWRDLASAFPTGCDQDHGAAWDISADGHVVVGLMWNGCAPQAFRWTDDGGAGTTVLLELLGEGPTTPTNRASAISDDGAVAAGFASLTTIDRTPAAWSADGSGYLLDPANVDEPGEVLSISENGAVLGGIWGNEAFVWSEAAGRENLPRPDTLLPSDPCYANAIAAGGDLVFGGCGSPFFTVPVAVVWTGSGVRQLVDIATENGLQVPDGFFLTTVLAAANDGSVLLGVAMNPDTFAQQSFVLRLPPSTYLAP